MKPHGVIAALLLVAPAHADVTRRECLDASEHAASLERDGKLLDSRRELSTCASASCQALIGAECTNRLDALNRRIPSVVFDVKDRDGNDLASVTMTMDHHPVVAEGVEAQIFVDPGEHVFTFEVEGLQAVEKRVVLREGEKYRHELITLSRMAPRTTPQAELTPVATAPTEQPPDAGSKSDTSGAYTSPERRTGRVTGAVLVGVGLSLFGATALFGYLGSRQSAAITAGGFASGYDISQADALGNAFNIAFGIGLATSLVVEAIGIPLLLANLGHSTKPMALNFRRGEPLAIHW
jgi:hypothetical protein